MLRKGRLGLAGCVVIVLSLFGTRANAGESADLDSAHADGESPPTTTVTEKVAQGDSDGNRYRLRLYCPSRIAEQDVQCVGGGRPCGDVAESFYYELLRAKPTGEPVWVRVDLVCLSPADLANIGIVTPELVRSEFRRLTWPKAELVIEPPEGETLVNFPTNFYTENTEPTTQQVTLLGTQITIEATPTSYTWHFEGDASVDSEVPGQPAPDPDFTDYTPEDLEGSSAFVTHRYLDAQVVVQPSVDVTYSGRYRIGGGAWTDIPDTLTVTGDSVNLRIIEGIPRLVGSP